MKEELKQLELDGSARIAEASDLKSLEEVRVAYLGRKGRITEILKGLGSASPEDRRSLGQMANLLKDQFAQRIDARKTELEAALREQKAQEQRVDMSLPGRAVPPGHVHVLNQIADEISDIFIQMGFQLALGPDVETEYYNFDALNTPDDHPARDSHDTFFVKPGVVLRTQTSPVQIRVMEQTRPPVAVIAPGRVYRVDLDATHSPMFVQMEGLLVDKGITFSDLKGTLMHFIHSFFGPDIQVRFRPHFFPFTEPSAEVDILWTARDRHTGEVKSKWLEILGCGMVHPEVFKNVSYDYEEYSGYAFGLGIDRIAMVRHGISSITHLYENDMRFLEQF
ncbi:MAG TPA: phenylalanine--tRNA ligase subunit alpha [Candidatus Hydrogenedentes bacterium]|jgi:phenylalanyl-tRNA synthetase alpha chain|nr:phenylalanine--tRNA ligase subunit alpha [Candidatus Hydrogenedentota bacterium]HOM46901.1 phenylalanine--tRNA ligase subunit alpha [Candidatus Hydrogenedentota bacterium]HOR49498.1 phenylalanine--tRNA ligase subunit alpha [Candidatus Hydrogenedentota bacterium]HPK23470.1 phenylalanine--tRNA ligase subunit alpha [Candidatus Hydrogenedentota bacterium]HQB01973.1 phenylalanine--tRNA ligase subunit alpha [Candidatus Hydrogenedentota bacterium]